MPSRTRSCRRDASRARLADGRSSAERSTCDGPHAASIEDVLARAQVPARLDAFAFLVQQACRRDVQRVGTTDRLGRLLGRQPEVRDERAVVEPRRDRHTDVDLAVRAAQAAEDRVMRPQVARVASAARRRHRHAVGELERPVRAHERRLEDVRPVDVASRRSSVTPSGSTSNDPPRSRSRIAQNVDGESKRGKHTQSTDPSRETSAAEWQSPISAWSPILGAARSSARRRCRHSSHVLCIAWDEVRARSDATTSGGTTSSGARHA